MTTDANMKKAILLLLAAAIALPVMPASAAQDVPAASEPVIGTNWSLKPKAKAAPKPQASADVQGPGVPPPQRLRRPQSRAAQAARPAAKPRPNNTALVNTLARAKRR